MSSLPENAFSAEDRRAMLTLARHAIGTAVGSNPSGHHESEHSCFSLCRGVFVTLEVFRRLRGCIGVIESLDSLRETIPHCARTAAFHDPRFPPLQAGELHALQIEISVLSRISPINLEEIVIGRHGLLVSTKETRGLLLPRVAIENRLSPEGFLEQTCCKAGLPRTAWREPYVQLFAFTCEVFREDSDIAVS